MQDQQSVARSDWFGQPRGLTILFLTEMWEKFSFFGMRALLVYYMTKQLLLTQGNASLIYGLYAASVFLTPLLGAAISDRWLGRRRAVILGGLIMAMGHFMMASEALFYPALAAIAIGSGFYLPNLPSQIGSLYSADDPRSASAYNIYYVGINTGGLIAPFVCGTIGELYGWHWGFTVAGAGMILGLVIYLLGSRYLPPEQPIVKPEPQAKRSFLKGDTLQRYKLLLTIAAIVMLLRGSYEQIANTIAIWSEAGVDRSVTGGLTIPMTWFQALNPLLVFTLTPILVWRWNRHVKQGRELTPLRKMAVGASLICSAYMLLTLLAAGAAVQGTAVGWPWLLLYFVLMTAGELYIFPVGLGLFARLAPVGFTATAIATWYLAGFAGNLLAGVLGSLWSIFTHATFFGLMGALAAVSALLFLLFDGYANRADRPVQPEGEAAPAS